MSESLEGPITWPEAGSALKNMNNNKSPRPDGSTVELKKNSLWTSELVLLDQLIKALKKASNQSHKGKT